MGGDDIHDVFGDLDWPGKPDIRLDHSNKTWFVGLYIEWFFRDRFAAQFCAFFGGFCAVLGRSELLRRFFDAAQLEAVICGGDVPLDVAALCAASAATGWADGDAIFIDNFWAAVEGLDDADRRRFLLFVTASDRVPLGGWGMLRITVQKNGTGDERLPTAYTCFNTLLLPRYTSIEHLRCMLQQAIQNSQGF